MNEESTIGYVCDVIITPEEQRRILANPSGDYTRHYFEQEFKDIKHYKMINLCYNDEKAWFQAVVAKEHIREFADEIESLPFVELVTIVQSF